MKESDNYINLEFDIGLGYGDIVIEGREPTVDDLLALPVVRWLNDNVGPLEHPRDPNKLLNGQGWTVSYQWNMLERTQRPRCWVLLEQPIDDRLITEFWMRFQR